MFIWLLGALCLGVKLFLEKWIFKLAGCVYCFLKYAAGSQAGGMTGEGSV